MNTFQQPSGHRVQFHRFVLNLTNHTLSDETGPVLIRPKVIQLVTFLVERRDRIVSKQEIAVHVWGTPHVADTAIFQVVSAARKLAPGVPLIKTHPNRGYQWVAQTNAVRPARRGWVRALTASAAAAAVVVSVLAIRLTNAPAAEKALDELTRLPPALVALQRGIDASSQGLTEQSVAWFEFALAEQPSSALLKLQLADALFMGGDVEQAMRLTQRVVDDPDADAYQKMSAWSLLGRAQFELGQLERATESASKVLEIQPSEGQALCTIEGTRTLLEQIVGRDPNNDRARQLLDPHKHPPTQGAALAGCTRLMKSPLGDLNPVFDTGGDGALVSSANV